MRYHSSQKLGQNINFAKDVQEDERDHGLPLMRIGQVHLVDFAKIAWELVLCPSAERCKVWEIQGFVSDSMSHRMCLQHCLHCYWKEEAQCNQQLGVV